MGFSAASGDATNTPFTFWNDILTIGEHNNYNSYTRQFSFPWSPNSKQIGFRRRDGGNWSNWEYINTNGGDIDITTNNNISYLKRGNIVCIFINNATVQKQNWVTVGSIPTNIAPSGVIQTLGGWGAFAAVPCGIRVLNTGNVQVGIPGSTTETASGIWGTLVYLI